VSTVSFLPTFESRILAKARGAGCAERRCHPPNMNGYAACHTVEAGFFVDRTCRGAPPAAIPYVRPADRHSPPFATLGRINGVIADVRGGCHSTVRYIAPGRKFGGKPGKTIAHIQILQYCVTRTQHSCCSHKRGHPHKQIQIPMATSLQSLVQRCGLCARQQGSRSSDLAGGAPRSVSNHLSINARACPTLIPEKRRLAWKPCGGRKREADRIKRGVAAA